MCIIHEVSISEAPLEVPKIESSKLSSLLAQHGSLEKARTRTNNAIQAISTYQGSFGAKTLEVQDLAAATIGADSVAEQLDDKLSEIEDKLAALAKEIVEERKLLGETKENKELRQRVTVMVFAEKECEVELVLVYGTFNCPNGYVYSLVSLLGVREATWVAVYDIYAAMDAKEKPISLIYKAGITQLTGEVLSTSINSLRLPPINLIVFRLGTMSLSLLRQQHLLLASPSLFFNLRGSRSGSHPSE